MKDPRLFIVVALGAILVSVCSSDSSSLEGSAHDEPLRMASESLVVKSYKNAETTSPSLASDEDSSEEYRVYQGVMGKPGVDFPIYSGIPVTSFTCRGVKKSGYYADLETNCQVFHVCDRNRKISFLCPNGTIFRQSHLICDWWFRVDCGKSVELYDESAEQLAADQKVYRARSEERDSRRKKLNRGHESNKLGEVSSSTLTSSSPSSSTLSTLSSSQERSINGRSETKSEKGEISTGRQWSRSNRKKSERHSKKVNNLTRTQNLGNEDLSGNIPPNHKKGTTKSPLENGQPKFKITVSSEQKSIEFVTPRKFSKPSPKLVSNNSYQENFFAAEAGSLVKELTNRSQVFSLENTFTDVASHASGENYNSANTNGPVGFNPHDGKEIEHFGGNKETTKQNIYSLSGEDFSSLGFTDNQHVNSPYSDSTTSSYEPEPQTYSSRSSVNFYQTGGNLNTDPPHTTEQQNFNSNYGKTYSTLIGPKDPQGNIYSITQSSNESSFQNGNPNSQTPYVTSNYETNLKTLVYHGIGKQTQPEFRTTSTSSNFDRLNFSGENLNQSQYDNIKFKLNVSDVSSERSNGVTDTSIINFVRLSTQKPRQFPVRYENTEVSYSNGNYYNSKDSLNLERNQEQKFGFLNSNGDRIPETSTNNFNSFESSFSVPTQQFSHSSNEPTENHNSFDQFASTKGSRHQTQVFENQFNADKVNDTNTFNLNELNSKNNYKYSENDYLEKEQPGSLSSVTIPDFGKSVKVEDFKIGGHTSIYPTDSYVNKQTNKLLTSDSSVSYPSTPLLQQEEERQYLAETASFGSNSEGNNLADFRNRFNFIYDHNQAVGTTGKFYEGANKPIETTVETYLTTRPAENQFFTTHDRTTFKSSPTVNTNKATYASSLDTRTPAKSFWPSTTASSYYKTPADFNTFNADNVYFTSTSSKELLNNVDQTERAYKIELLPEQQNKTSPSEVNLILQELNINKGVSQVNAADKTYDDFVREGLEVPPSSGPNAIRSFALYFGSTNFTQNNETKLLETVTHHADLSQTTDSFEMKKKEVLKHVDDLVHLSSVNITTESSKSHSNKLPNSLTVKTQVSYLQLFPKEETPASVEIESFTNINSEPLTESDTESSTTPVEYNQTPEEFYFGTTNFGDFTEEPTIINSELGKNDLDLSQTRGLVDQKDTKNSDKSHVTPNLRRLAQVFTKALSAYLDDPQAFRKILSEIRPTEPAIEWQEKAFDAGEYTAGTHEIDEVLDFSDVTSSTLKKGLAATIKNLELANQSERKDIYNSSIREAENFILPKNRTYWATNIELTVPFAETLDESQSRYYTPLPFTKTTNTVAEEINGFIGQTKNVFTQSEDEEDSYLPITTTESNAGRYGGFQNNNKKTTKYSPYGAELSSTPYPALGIDSFSKSSTDVKSSSENVTLTDRNFTSFFSHLSQNDTAEGEILLGKELNNLVLLQKFTTPRRFIAGPSTVSPHLSTRRLGEENYTYPFADDESEKRNTLGRSISDSIDRNTQKSTTSSYFDLNTNGNSSLLHSATSNPKGFFITYSWQNEETTTFKPLLNIKENNASRISKSLDQDDSLDLTDAHSIAPPHVEFNSGTFDMTTPSFAKAIKSVQRIVELQGTLMFNTSNSTDEQKDEAREVVDQMMGNVNVTSSTTQDLMKVMEMAAKNETYKRLVLLLVNDKSAKNKTVEEAKFSLLKALLTPIIRPSRFDVPIVVASKSTEELSPEGVRNPRKSKPVVTEFTENLERPTTVSSITSSETMSSSNGHHFSTVTTSIPLVTSKPNASNATAQVPEKNGNESKKQESTQTSSTDSISRTKTELENLQIIKKAVENSKNDQIKINSVDESAILNSDSRAVELLKSLYSLAARWG